MKLEELEAIARKHDPSGPSDGCTFCRLVAEVKRLRAALVRIEGEREQIGAAQMATIAWEALYEEE